MSEKYAIRIHWGYWTRYALNSFHHVDYCWDGEVRTSNGQILRCSLIKFIGIWGPQREELIPLDKPHWHWHPKNNFNRCAGILFHVKGNAETILHFSTRTIDMSFSIGELIKRKIIQRHIGSRYSCVKVTALFDGYDPNLDREEDIAAMIETDGRWRKLVHARDFRGPLRRRYRTDWVWTEPGKSVEVDIEEPDWEKVQGGEEHSLIATFRCGAIIPGREGKSPEELTKDKIGTNQDLLDNLGTISIPYQVFLNNQEVAHQQQYFAPRYFITPAVGWLPVMEEIMVELPEKLFHAGMNTLRMQNNGKYDHLLIARLYLEEIEKKDFEVSVSPHWVLLEEKFEIAVHCRSVQQNVRVRVPSGVTLVDKIPDELGSGEHRFHFRAEEPLADMKIRFESDKGICEANIEQVVAVKQEKFPMRVGLEDNMFATDYPGLKENILQDLKDTQLGDFMVFRRAVQSQNQIVRWARLCRKYGIYFQIAHTTDLMWSTSGENINTTWASAAAREAGQYFIGYQWTEHDGPIHGYLVNPKLIKLSVPEQHRTMRTAYEDYLAYIKRLVTISKQRAKMQTWLMHSVIGHSHAYKAGMDGCLTQLNKTHNVVLLADARGAARTYDKSMWAAYCAEGAHLNPEGEEHLRMWWLALHLSYICGASFANDEETLLGTWHERLYARGDRFPRTRQKILRDFNRYVKAHPRRGRIRVKQALLTGRYACDVADGISKFLPLVWRNFGAKTSQWRPLTPEYGLRYLDVFFPGVWLQSLVQSPERLRRFYSGTPYGELELIPIEAPEDILQQFSLLLLLGWNTMNEATYESLKKYVQQGGRLFMSVPHLTMNESRTFLLDNIEPLNLLKNGDFSDLFGVKIMGRGERLSCIKTVNGVKQNPIEGVNYPFTHDASLPPVGPQHPPVYLAETQLRGAEVLAYDEKTDQPLLVRYRLGQGEAYLLLTHDFPGNSRLSGFMTDLIHGLARMVPSPVSLEDPSGDVYFTVREETKTGLTRIHLLSTDWTKSGNKRHCVLRLAENSLQLIIKEGRLSEMVWFDNLAVLIEDEKLYIEGISLSTGTYSVKLHGFGKGEILLRTLDKKPFKTILFEGKPVDVLGGEEWTTVKMNFGYRTTGKLTLRV